MEILQWGYSSHEQIRQQYLVYIWEEVQWSFNFENIYIVSIFYYVIKLQLLKCYYSKAYLA